MPNTTILITGATAGMGRQLARDLAVRGATLLLHGRDQAKLDALADELRGWSPAVRTYRADLSDLDGVRDMAARLRDSETRLDVLVNNAAAGGGSDPTRRETSRQGYELRLAVNTLAPYLLVRELAPLLSEGARVVNVASMGQAPVDFDDLMFTRGYEGLEAYCRSKLALIMASFDLAEELAPRGVTVNALHPAHLMDTPMVREFGYTPVASVDDGALPTLRLVVGSDVAGVTGRYFDRFDEARAHEQAYDPAARSRLRTAVAALTGVAVP